MVGALGETVALGEYDALAAKADAFGAAVHTRRAADLQCRAGCEACCHVALSVSAVEAASVQRALDALEPAAREDIRARAGADPGRCVMLEADGRCAIYEGRPLVCRTQGHALRYPHGVVPVAAVLGRAGTEDVTWCPLNYVEAPPRAADVLDAERVDVMLALVNGRFLGADADDEARLARRALSELAAR